MQTTSEKGGGALLRRYRLSRGLSLRDAALRLRVSHVTVWEWEAGSRIPSHRLKPRIERWSRGAVPAFSWPLSGRELAKQERAEELRSTGTEGQ